jgi:hypothetical protein
METVQPSETSVKVYRTARQHIQEENFVNAPEPEWIHNLKLWN